MKRISSIVVGSLLAVLIASGGISAKLNAQSEPGAIFTIPFAFSANGHNVDAGTYQIHLGSTPNLMSIRNTETGKEQIFSVRPEQQRAIATKGLLVFHRCGTRKDLAEFHIPGTNFYSQTISAHHARNSEAENCMPVETTTVAAR